MALSISSASESPESSGSVLKNSGTLMYFSRQVLVPLHHSLNFLGLWKQTLGTLMLFWLCKYFFTRDHPVSILQHAYWRIVLIISWFSRLHFLYFILHLLGSVVVYNQPCRILLDLLLPSWYNTAIVCSILPYHHTKLLLQSLYTFYLHLSYCTFLWADNFRFDHMIFLIYLRGLFISLFLHFINFTVLFHLLVSSFNIFPFTRYFSTYLGKCGTHQPFVCSCISL